jgi:hypothetical protein
MSKETQMAATTENPTLQYLQLVVTDAETTDTAKRVEFTTEAAADPEIAEAVRELNIDGHTAILWAGRGKAAVDIYPSRDATHPIAYGKRGITVVAAPWT